MRAGLIALGDKLGCGCASLRQQIAEHDAVEGLGRPISLRVRPSSARAVTLIALHSDSDGGQKVARSGDSAGVNPLHAARLTVDTIMPNEAGGDLLEGVSRAAPSRVLRTLRRSLSSSHRATLLLDGGGSGGDAHTNWVMDSDDEGSSGDGWNGSDNWSDDSDDGMDYSLGLANHRDSSAHVIQRKLSTRKASELLSHSALATMVFSIPEIHELMPHLHTEFDGLHGSGIEEVDLTESSSDEEESVLPPSGWLPIFAPDDQFGMGQVYYFHHAASGASLWHKPSQSEADEAVAKEYVKTAEAESAAVNAAHDRNRTGWWHGLNLEENDTVRHTTRGEGTIVRVNPALDGRVHVRFGGDAGEVHRYYERSWGKFTLVAKFNILVQRAVADVPAKLDAAIVIGASTSRSEWSEALKSPSPSRSKSTSPSRQRGAKKEMIRERGVREETPRGGERSSRSPTRSPSSRGTWANRWQLGKEADDDTLSHLLLVVAGSEDAEERSRSPDRSLLSDSTSASPSRRDRRRREAAPCPSYLTELLSGIFAEADTDGDGTLSTMELMRVLKRRAAHTGLNGDSHAVFSLKAHMEKMHATRRVQIGDKVSHPHRGFGTVVAIEADEEGKVRRHVHFQRSGEIHRYLERSWAKMEDEELAIIERRGFIAGLLWAMRRDPNGHVSQWISKEVQDGAAVWKEENVGQKRWETLETQTAGDVQLEGGAVLVTVMAEEAVHYVHKVSGVVSEQIPAVLAACRRCDAHVLCTRSPRRT